MHTNFHIHLRRILLGILLSGIVLLSSSINNDLNLIRVEKVRVLQSSTQLSVILPQTGLSSSSSTLTSSNEVSLKRHIIINPLVSPFCFDVEQISSALPKSRSASARVLGGKYVFGCSPVAEANAVMDLEHGGRYPIENPPPCQLVSGSGLE